MSSWTLLVLMVTGTVLIKLVGVDEAGLHVLSKRWGQPRLTRPSRGPDSPQIVELRTWNAATATTTTTTTTTATSDETTTTVVISAP